MAETKITVDLQQVEKLDADVRAGAVVVLHRAAEAGQRFLRQEVPKDTHNLQQGVSADVDVARLRAQLIVSARRGRVAASSALVHSPRGGTRKIQLRAQPAYDYARAVAAGTGVFARSDIVGPQPVVRPRTARALLIPVAAPPSGESYVTSRGQTFVVRRYLRGMQPNPYDLRAAARLEAAMPAIVDEVGGLGAAGAKEL